MRSWIIGSRADCDLVVDSPLASGRHCELKQTPDGFVLDDLGSTNGTFVNGLRIASPTRVTTGDEITLGRTVPMPWPPEVTRFVRIGRLADNDIVLDDSRVSGHHARLIVVAGSQPLIEDIGSSNGTFLNSADRRVTGPTPITESDILYFGTLAVPAARLLGALNEPATAAPAPSAATTAAEPRPASISERPAIAPWEGNRWLLAWFS
jgi:pSer/pThr/pTyr-binding forkhead associated (FHA) protein